MADLQLHTLLICDYALTAQDGKLGALGVFSQINVARLLERRGLGRGRKPSRPAISLLFGHLVDDRVEDLTNITDVGALSQFPK